MPAACGSVTKATDGGADAPGDVAPPTVDQACSEYATDVCSALEACGSLALQLFYGDNTTCVARQRLSCTTDQTASGITRTTSDIVACAQAIGGTACADIVAGNFPSACQIKPGTVVNGGSCGSSWQCQSTHCEKPTSACGTCSARQPTAGDCTSNDGCNVGSVCANNKCVVPGGMGAKCDDKNPCQGNLYCTGTGACAKQVGLGGSCADGASACDLLNGAGCNPFNNTCVMVAIAKGGDTCGVVNGTLTICMEGDACPNATLTQTSVCANTADDGEACGTAAPGRNCVPPATCQMNLCRLPSADSCR